MSSENPTNPADRPTPGNRPNQPGSRGYGEYDANGVWRPRFGQMTSEVTKSEFEAKAAKEAAEKAKAKAAAQQTQAQQMPSPAWPWGGQGPSAPDQTADHNRTGTPAAPTDAGQPPAGGYSNPSGNATGRSNAPGGQGWGPGSQLPPQHPQQGAPPAGGPRPSSPWMSGQAAQPNPQDGRICPPQLRIASWIWIIFAIWTMFGAIMLARTPDFLSSALGSQLNDAVQLSGMDRSDYLSLLLKTTIVASVLIAAALVVAAIFVRRGKNWARILGIAVSIFGVLAGITAGPFGLVIMMMLGASIYVSITPPATNFIRARKAAKRPH